MMPAARSQAAEAGALLDIVALDQGGVLVTGNGALVRVVDVTPVNPVVMSEAECERHGKVFGRLINRLKPGQSLQFVVEGSPIPLGEVLAGMREETSTAIDRQPQDRQEALKDLASAREQSIVEHGAERPVMLLRTHVVIPYVPPRVAARVDWEGLRDALRPGRRILRAPLTRGLDDYYRAVRALSTHVQTIVSDLGSLGMDCRLMNGLEVAELLRRRFNPSSVGRVRMPRVEIVGSLDEVGDASRAAETAHRLRAQIARSPIDLLDSHMIGVEEDLERVMCVASVLEETEFGWLLEAMQIDGPFVVSTHVHATDKTRERKKLKRQHKRVHGLVRGAENAGKAVDPDMEDHVDELGAVQREMKKQRASLFDMSVYMTVREPGSGVNTVEHKQALRRASESARDALAGVSEAAVQFGAWDQEDLWRSTLAIGQDHAWRTHRYVTRNVADSLPLVGPRCGSPEGIPMFLTADMRTLERLNPWDRSHPNGLMVVTGQQGSGKTMWLITTGMALLTHGAHVAVVDRSGHWEFATLLVPGATHLSIGGARATHTICPWDVPDLHRVEPDKIRYLRGLHVVMLGGEVTDDEKSLLGEGIRGVYRQCAREGRQPLERDLQVELRRLESEDRAAANNRITQRSTILGSIANRLGRYVLDGEDAFLADRPTTVPKDAPLTVFDTRPAGEHLAASMLIVMEHTLAAVERRGQERVLSGDMRSWCRGDFLGFDETWAFVKDPRAGAVFDDLSRRVRHYRGLVMAALTQFLGDFNNEYGRALLNGAHQKLFFSQSVDEMRGLQATLKLSDREMDEIDGLGTAKGTSARAYWINGKRGRGVVDLRLGGLEYWTATSEPNEDRPRRERMLAAHDGDAWATVRALAAMEGIR